MARKNLPNLGGLGRFSSYFTQGDVALAILRSRTMSERIIERFDLQKVYRTSKRDDTVRRLRDAVDVKMGADGAISVKVDDRSASRAADMANALLAELDRFNRENRSFRARRSRAFLETRVAETDSILRSTEAVLVEYQRKRGSIVLPPEARGAMEGTALIMSQKAQTELELELARQFASPQSEEVARLEARLRELRRQIGDLPTTQAGGSAAIREQFIQQQVLAFLTAQLEDARLREAMDTPTIQVLDEAAIPDRPIWPRKSWLAAFGFVVGGLAGAADLERRRRSGVPA
jgi:capsule polysaccharide export protein KpsE/RkpR